MKNLVLKIIR